MQYAMLAHHNIPPLLLNIDEVEYNKLKTAFDSLNEVLFIEEKFDIVLDNLLEFEVEALRISEKNVLFTTTNFTVEKLTLNRRVVNLLTACRLYLDHTRHHLSTLFGKDSNEYISVERQSNEEYDHHFGYRFMEQMRNVVQHRGYAISELSFYDTHAEKYKYHSRIVDHRRDRPAPSRFFITPIVSVENLRKAAKAGSFKKKILQEIEGMNPPKVNLLLAIREYVEGISRIHGLIRQHVRDRLPVWDQLLKVATTRIEQSTVATVWKDHSQVLIAYDQNRRCVEFRDIPGDALQDIMLFVTKNGVFPEDREKLSAGFVTNQALVDKEDAEDTELIDINIALQELLKSRRRTRDIKRGN